MRISKPKALMVVSGIVFLTLSLTLLIIKGTPSATTSGQTIPQSQKLTTNKADTIIKALKEGAIVFSKEWDLGGVVKLQCVVTRSGKEKYLGDPGHQLTIYDEKGKVLYEDLNGGKFINIEQVWLLRNETSQLVIHKNEGGKPKSLQILDYQDGQVVELDGEYDTYELLCEIRPSFRQGINLAEEPYEILLTDGVGLPSPIEKVTTVFRFIDGQYKKVGKFKRSELDNNIEKLLTK
jgi:hypothetical protein